MGELRRVGFGTPYGVETMWTSSVQLWVATVSSLGGLARLAA